MPPNSVDGTVRRKCKIRAMDSADTERMVDLDALRGFALLGILVIDI